MNTEADRDMSHQAQDLTSSTLKVLFIAGLIMASVWIMQSFLPAIVWATTLVVATWPVMLRVQKAFGSRRGVAVMIMMAALLLILIVPFWLAITIIGDNLDQIGELIRKLLTMRVPVPPDWVANVPIVGPKLADTWRTLSNAGFDDLAPRIAPYVGALTQWFASTAGSLGGVFIQVLLTALIAAIMYANGEAVAGTAYQFGRRLGGDRGEMAVKLAGQAIRSVALGVVVTAVAQTAISGLGLVVVGTPFAAMLTALILVLCLIQLGPSLVLIPAVIWMYYSGDAVWATVLLAFTLVATTIDQFIRPILIRRGADLPLLLILSGVIGGLIAFGILGMFIGPTVLAVAYTLFNAWLADSRETTPVTAQSS